MVFLGLFLAACLVLLNVMTARVCPGLSATYRPEPVATGQFKVSLMAKRWKTEVERAELVGKQFGFYSVS